MPFIKSWSYAGISAGRGSEMRAGRCSRRPMTMAPPPSFAIAIAAFARSALCSSLPLRSSQPLYSTSSASAGAARSGSKSSIVGMAPALTHLPRPPHDRKLASGQLAADDRGTFGKRLELGKGGPPRDVFHAAIGGGDQPFRRQVLECRTDTGGDGLGRFRLGVAHADHAKDHGLVAEPVEGLEIEIGLSGFDRDLLNLRGRKLGQKRIHVRLVARDIGIANAEVQGGRPGDPVECLVDRR